MNNTLFLSIFSLSLFILAACENKHQDDYTPLASEEIPIDAIDEFSQMNVVEQKGTKGQIFIQNTHEIKWFESISNTLMYLKLPETATQPMIAYVTLSNADSNPIEPLQWIKVEEAWFIQQPSNNHFSASTWSAYQTQQEAEEALSPPFNSIYRFQEITLERLTQP